MKLYRIITLIAPALALGVPLFGQPAQPAAPAVPTDSEVITLSPFTVATQADKGYQAGNSVSATRIDTPIKDLPFQVTAFDQQFITDIDARELPDIIKYAAGAVSGSDGYTTGDVAVMVRNFQSNPQRDGLPAPRFVDASNIERVEIVKGPASLFYGQIAPGGVVNYVTKLPEATAFASFSGEAGSYNYARTTADVNQPLNDHFFFRFTGAYENEEQYVNPFKGHIANINPSLLVKLNDSISVTLDYQYYSRQEKPWDLQPQNASVNSSAYLGAQFSSVFAGYIAQYEPGTVVDSPRFSAADPNDFRNITDNMFGATVDIRHSENWSTRIAFNTDTYWNTNRQTSRGDVTVTLPAAVLAAIPADYKDWCLEIPGLIQQYLYNAATTTADSRREQYFQNGYLNHTIEADTTGKVQLPFGTWKPLIGAQWYYGEQPGVTETLNSNLYGGTSSDPDWDIRNPATFVDPISYDPTPQTYTLNADTNGRFDNRAVYCANQFSLFNDRLLAVLGLRYTRAWTDVYNPATNLPSTVATEGSKTTPQVGIGYKITPDVMLYGNYSESFLLPTNAVLVVAGLPTGPAAPMLGKGWEGGLKFDLAGGRISGTVDGFNIEEANYIIDFKTVSSGQTLDNEYQGNTITSKGGEFELTYSPTDNLQILANASYCNTTYTEVGSAFLSYLIGTRPQYSARDRENVWARYNFTGLLKGLWVAGGFNYSGKRAEITNNPWLYLPNQMIWDSALGYDWKMTKYNVSTELSWKNMTNVWEIQTVRDRGEPERLIAETTVRF